MQALMTKLSWYYARLKVLSFSEVLYRFNQIRTIIFLRIRQRLQPYTPLPPDTFEFCRESNKLPLPQFDSIHDAEANVNGEWSALGFAWHWQSDKSWFVAPDTNRLWPSIFFADIPFRQGNPYGDVRVAWEPARLQQLVLLAIVARTSESNAMQRRAVDTLRNQLLSFYRANPPTLGIHYISAMECALRLIAICHSADMVRDRLTGDIEFWTSVANLAISHALFLEKRLSLFSSAGNHTVAECAGLIYAGILFPEHPRASHWVVTGIRVLEIECERQILPDGGGLEQAFWYHLFVTDLLALTDSLLRHHDQFSKPIGLALDRARRFIAAMSSSYDDAPDIGDRDSGFALSPLLKESWIESKVEEMESFDEAGYTVIQKYNEIGRERLIFDHGPLGMPPLFGHGHADALSIWFSIEGEDLLRGSGTYTYTGDQQWRNFFRSTPAHNTLSLDRASQSKSLSPFQWSKNYSAQLVHRIILDDAEIILVAEHDGYAETGYTHWRAISYKPGYWLAVWDYLSATSSAHPKLDPRVHWHLGGACTLHDNCCITTLNSGLKVRVTSQAQMKLEFGQHTPPQAWQSKTYGAKHPAYTLTLDGIDAFDKGVTTIFTYNSATSLSIERIDNDFREQRLGLMNK